MRRRQAAAPPSIACAASDRALPPEGSPAWSLAPTEGVLSPHSTSKGAP